ncbi:septum formation initiator family protein [Mobilitalea sibirica]|uniref:Septum formation initiator family protein n=1 Tax=Mobilitalea sibirica TaxID=1462919 RepID=A0A8J7H253_9FIRM|nr:septum formation initiator family protein [Mobilitalea sibirica]MBH1940738.1 septum formation initiator family protein [Mobilitalea sibirica]
MARRYKKRTGIGIIIFIVLNICGILVYGRLNLEKQRDDLDDKIKSLETKIEEQKEREIDIKNLEAYVQTKKYIEEVAREKLGLVYEYELIFQREE